MWMIFVITGDNTQMISELKSYLQKKFQKKIWDHYNILLGIEVVRSKKKISLFRRKYVLDILLEADILGCSKWTHQ